MRGARIRVWGDTAGPVEQGFGDSGMETGDAQVGG